MHRVRRDEGNGVSSCGLILRGQTGGQPHPGGKGGWEPHKRAISGYFHGFCLARKCTELFPNKRQGTCSPRDGGWLCPLHLAKRHSSSEGIKRGHGVGAGLSEKAHPTPARRAPSWAGSRQEGLTPTREPQRRWLADTRGCKWCRTGLSCCAFGSAAAGSRGKLCLQLPAMVLTDWTDTRTVARPRTKNNSLTHSLQQRCQKTNPFCTNSPGSPRPPPVTIQGARTQPDPCIHQPQMAQPGWITTAALLNLFEGREVGKDDWF